MDQIGPTDRNIIRMAETKMKIIKQCRLLPPTFRIHFYWTNVPCGSGATKNYVTSPGYRYQDIVHGCLLFHMAVRYPYGRFTFTPILYQHKYNRMVQSYVSFHVIPIPEEMYRKLHRSSYPRIILQEHAIKCIKVTTTSFCSVPDWRYLKRLYHTVASTHAQ